MRAYLVALALILGACGEDEPPPAPPRPPSGGGPAPAKNAGNTKGGKALKPMRRIEERVGCPTPSDAKKCDPKAPICATGQYCIPAGNDHYCGVCPERDAIRHTFKPRDFTGPDIRDPFMSFLLGPGLGAEGKEPVSVTPKCTRKDQFVATSSSYQQLKLIGIVSQGTQRKVMLTDGRIGHIVKKGDCVGKEKAVVKDIGAGYITFAVEAVGKADPAEYSMQLHPMQLSVGDPDVIDSGATTVPLVAPPSAVPRVAPPTQEGTTTTIIQENPPAPTVIPGPQQAPTQLRP